MMEIIVYITVHQILSVWQTYLSRYTCMFSVHVFKTMQCNTIQYTWSINDHYKSPSSCLCRLQSTVLG